jgi:hypothetical protein
MRPAPTNKSASEGSSSDFRGFRQGQCVIDVNPEIPNSVLNLAMTKQDLDGS